jgi:tetratricopeptide (TPR) repeat protein
MRNKLGMKATLLFVVVALPGAGIWAARRERASAASNVQASPSGLLSNMPRGGGGLTDRAIAEWSGKLRKNEKDPLAWSALGDSLMQKSRETADVTYYGLAEKAYQQSLAIDPQSPAAVLGIAWVHGGRHEFDESITWAKKSLALNPREQAAYGLIGDAQVELGQYEAAFESYQKMLDLKPNLASYSRGAHLLYLTGDTRKAIALMSRAIETGAPYAENTAWCRAQLGKILTATGNVKAAEQVLEDAVKRTPANYHVNAALGEVKAAKKDYPSAIAAYRKAVAAAPQIESLVALGDLYRLTGEPEAAETQFSQVEAIHRLHKANGSLGDRLVALFYADHDRNLPEALRLAQEEYRQFKNVYAADTLAWCLYKNGRYAEAREIMRTALARKTPEAQFLYHAGMIEAKLGDRSAAQKRLYQALSLNPRFHPVSASLAVSALKSLGSRAPAS